MRTFLVGPDDVGRVRFAASALWEAVQAVRALRDPVKARYHRPWLTGLAAADVLAGLPVLDVLSPRRGYTPGFLIPVPRPGRRPDPAREIAALRRTPPAVVAAGLREAVRRTSSARGRAALEELAVDPASTLAAVADELAAAWDVLVAPWWPAVRELLAADLAHRSDEVVRLGVAAAVGDLHRGVRWHGDRLEVAVPAPGDGVTALDGRGLLLVPSAFGWPHVIAVDEPWPPTVVYPARGIGALWTAPSSPPEALGRLLGTQRARVLAALAAPATTTDLALRLGLAPATVSSHLRVLHDAGLVARRRSGHQVPYRRTSLGASLLAAAPPEPGSNAQSRA